MSKREKHHIKKLMETEPILKKKPPISNFTDWRKQFDFPNGPTGDHLQIT